MILDLIYYAVIAKSNALPYLALKMKDEFQNLLTFVGSLRMLTAWRRITLIDEVEIQVEPGRAGITPEQVWAFIQAVTAAYRRVREPGSASR